MQLQTPLQVGELQELDRQVRENINGGVVLAEKLVAGKLNKQQYVESESSLRKKQDDIIVKMEEIQASL